MLGWSFCLYFLVGVIGIFILFHPTLLSGFALMQTDVGDTRLNNYFLEHSYQVVFNPNYIGELWSPTFFYPAQKTLAFSENLFASAPVYWLFRGFTSSSLAFQLWMIAVCLLNFTTFAFLMRKFKVSHFLSAFGAFLFAFSIPRIAHLGHQQLLPQFFTPLAFWAAWQFISLPKNKWLILFLLFIYLQLLAGIYLGWFLFFSLPIFLVTAYRFIPEKWKIFAAYWKGNKKTFIASVLLWIALTFITFFPYLEARSVFGSRNYLEVDSMLPRFSSWFLVPRGNFWSSLLGDNPANLPMVNEHFMFAGFTIILLSMICLAYITLNRREIIHQERTWLISICLMVFFIIFILTLRLPFEISLWRIIYEIIPGTSAIRGVTRIWTIAYFYLLIAVIVGLDALLKSEIFGKKLHIVIISLLCILGISEQVVTNPPSFEKTPLLNEVSELSDLIKPNCDVAYFLLNPEKPFYGEQISAMWAGLEANIPVINGLSGQSPPNYGEPTKSMNGYQIINWIDSAGKAKPARLCIISPKSFNQPDKLLLHYATARKQSDSGEFILDVIQLPFPKVFSQEIKTIDFPQIVAVKSSLILPILLKNTGNFLWSNKGSNPTNFSYRWIDLESNQPIFNGEGERTPLPYDLSPGELAALNIVLKTPHRVGKYKLILTMVQESVAWFSDKNADSPAILIEVR